MKPVSILVTCLSMFLWLSCAKSFESSNEIVALTGNWNWVRTDGGINWQIHETPATTGKNITLQFKADNKYVILTNGVVSSQGIFHLSSRKSIHDHESKPFIDFSTLTDQDMLIFDLNGDELVLTDNATDGISMSYIRAN